MRPLVVVLFTALACSGEAPTSAPPAPTMEPAGPAAAPSPAASIADIADNTDDKPMAPGAEPTAANEPTNLSDPVPTPASDAAPMPEDVPTPAAASAPSPQTVTPDPAPGDAPAQGETTASPESTEEPAVAVPTEEATAETVDYTVDTRASWLYVVVRFDPDALAVKLGHDHMVRATRFDATLKWHPTDATKCDVQFVIPVEALEPDVPGGRERAGLDALDAVSAKALGSIRDNFRAKKQLDMDSYPEIRFRSTSCDGTTGSVRVAGELTMRGVTKPVTARMRVTLKEDGSFRAVGGFSTLHTTFGFKPYSNMAGAFRNLDELSFTLDVVASPS